MLTPIEFLSLSLVCSIAASDQATISASLSDKLISLHSGKYIDEVSKKEEQKGNITADDFTNITYLENTDKLVLSNGTELKLIHREKDGFNLKEHSNFNMFPVKHFDMIRLKLSHQ